MEYTATASVVVEPTVFAKHPLVEATAATSVEMIIGATYTDPVFLRFDAGVEVTGSVDLTSKPVFYYPTPPASPPAEEPEYPTAAYGGIIIRPLMGIVVQMSTPSIVDGKPT
jgi:hypothetical protein